MAREESSPREQRDIIMQRVRVGVTGLAAVFLLTLLAASVLSLLGQDDHAARLANGAAVTSGGPARDDAPKEPLAELGVAPGGNPPKSAAVAPAAVAPAIPASSHAGASGAMAPGGAAQDGAAPASAPPGPANPPPSGAGATPPR